MPQSIYQGSTYIGEQIQTVPPATWRKAPVWNWVDGGLWIQLNADIGPVDFALRNLAYDRVLIEIHDSQNYDHVGDYQVWLKTGAGGTFVRRPDLDVPDNTSTKWITGLTATTYYEVKIVVSLLSGGVTPDSIQKVTTPANPTPYAVTNLTSPARTNAWTDLSWTTPAGSSATRYNVYWGRAGQGPSGHANIATTSYRVAGLAENVPYWYFVRGVNASGLEGPDSNHLHWHTGWGEIRRQGSDEDIVWKPREWGSYRPDIQWQWARENGIKDRNPHLYQGYWPGNNWHGASNPSANLEAGRTRRYWGTVVYTDDDIRAQLDAKHGAGVGGGIVTTKMAFRRMYRHTNPGYVGAQDMVWHLTNANPFNSGQPPTYGKYEGEDMKQGEKIDYYRLPGSWGTALIRGTDDGTKVNGLVLHRSDNVTNGYGAAGYGRWSGHMLKDPDTSGDWRYSNLNLMIEGSWNVLVRAYKGPFQW